jgi:pimeloyl-ACP methyl ester carboxylesterase
MAYAENGGTRLFWAQSGAGPTVVLIQGFGYTHDMWYRTVPVLFLATGSSGSTTVEWG